MSYRVRLTWMIDLKDNVCKLVEVHFVLLDIISHDMLKSTKPIQIICVTHRYCTLSYKKVIRMHLLMIDYPKNLR
ncbi:hypothetical protein WN943_027654 [Citrus x changshan-huyou]